MLFALHAAQALVCKITMCAILPSVLSTIPSCLINSSIAHKKRAKVRKVFYIRKCARTLFRKNMFFSLKTQKIHLSTFNFQFFIVLLHAKFVIICPEPYQS